MTEPDVIVDILNRVKDKAELSEEVVSTIESDARRYWGGERCYIAKAGESPRRRDAHDRAERIRAEHRQGERVPLLARRHQLTERHVRRILGIVEATQQPAANEGVVPVASVRPRRRRRREADTVLP